jgi:hypothetical protein
MMTELDPIPAQNSRPVPAREACGDQRVAPVNLGLPELCVKPLHVATRKQQYGEKNSLAVVGDERQLGRLQRRNDLVHTRWVEESASLLTD